ncbi:MAG TPA: DUF2071 domain-containing protein [Blastocatellia bacterium]|nr:DUF2071 domain-containing protein [Blastocatellia bacterium]
MPRTFLTAEWRYLAMLNYEVDPRVLTPRVPAGTDLDYWNGAALVSVVGFLFWRTKVLGMTIPFHRNFEEVNLRFYVRRKVAGEWRRGVVFIKEIVPRRAVAAIARSVYGEKYVAMPMENSISLPRNGANGAVEYSWSSGATRNSLRVGITGEPAPITQGSEAEFITEHYWGYTARENGVAIEYEVQHPRWAVWESIEQSLTCDVASVYGTEFVECLTAAPRSAFVATGSEVAVRTGKRL